MRRGTIFNYEVTLAIGDREIDVRLRGCAYLGSRPTRSHPGDPPEIEILGVYDTSSGEEILCSEDDLEPFTTPGEYGFMEIMEHLADCEQASMDDRADFERDLRRAPPIRRPGG